MATQFLWGNIGSVMHLLTTELNSLAINTLTALGPEINNTNGPMEGQLDIVLASAAFVAPSYMNIYLLPSNDLAGSNYPTLRTNAQEALANYWVGTVFIPGTTAAQRAIYPGIRIPGGKFKAFAATGGSCPTLASSGNTVDLYPTPVQY